MKRVLIYSTIVLVVAVAVLLTVGLNDDTTNIPVSQKINTDNPRDLDYIADNLQGGGPPKDGIPAIDNPKYLSAKESTLEDSQIVFGVIDNGQALAFPENILVWHEIVNIESGSVTFCPLTGTAIGYSNENLGVSGKLYNSNLVFYDRSTDSYFPQILGTASSGDRKSETLPRFKVVTTTWIQWKTLHPNTKVLSEETGHVRDYTRDPYPAYENVQNVWFPLTAEDNRFHSKKIVTGVELNGEYLAIPKSEFKEVGEQTYTLGEAQILILYNNDLDTIEVYDDDTELITLDAFWFAWFAFYPETKVLDIEGLEIEAFEADSGEQVSCTAGHAGCLIGE